MFTLDRNPGPNVVDFVPAPLELALESAFDQASPAVRRNVLPYLPGLMKLTLPRTEAPALLYLLHVNRVSAASLFPGYAGVVESIREQGLLRDPHTNQVRGRVSRVEDAGTMPARKRRP
jgi:hypothetical protein